MKKQILYLASAALVAGLAACSNDELGESSRLNLKKGELSATIQDAVSTRTNIDGQYKLTWADKDAIGVYGTLSDNSQNYKYEITKAGEPEAITGVFAAAADQDIADDFTPAVAYYPYGTGHNEKITSQGKLALNLDDEIIYTEGEVKAPLVGDVVNGNISFKAVTALLKIRVENVPCVADNTLTKAVLTTEGKKAIAGKAYVDLTKDADKRVLEVSDDSKKQSITITFENKAVGSYDFYYIIPEGDYDLLTVTLQKDGDTGGTYTKTLISEKSLEAKANHIYTKTLRFDGEDLEDGVIAQLNDDLVTVANNGSVTADLSKATANVNGKILLPSVASGSDEDPLDQITINLQSLGATQSLTLQPSITDGLTPKKVIVKVSNATTKSGDASQKLTIALPNSSVELAPAEDNGEVTLDAVDSSTADNVLRIKTGVTVTALTRTKGNVYVEKGATATGCTDTEETSYYIFKEEGATVQNSSSSDTFTYTELVGDEMYTLLYPTKGDRPKLSQDYALKAAIEIAVDDVELDLNGYVLTAPTAGTAITVKNGGKLTIVDNKDYKNAAATAKVTSSKENVATIVVENGGTLIVNGGEINNSYSTTTANAYAINANGAVTISGGKVTSVLNVKDQSNVSVEAGTVSGAVNVKGESKTATFSVSGTGVVSAAITADANSVVNVNGGTVSAGITSSKATSVVNINGGTISTSASANTVTITEGTVTVKGGTISNSTNEKAAIDIKKGTLTVTGTGEPSISGYYAISSTPSADDDATITLEADAAQYKGTKYVVYNSNGSTNAKTVKLTITAGWFDGDFKLDETKYFIKGGHYTNCNQTLKTDQAIQYIGAGYELSASTDDDGYYTASKIK
jgi:hypothetical protein